MSLQQIVKQMINLDSMPPDWEFAARHAEACRPGLAPNSQQNNASNIICPCCLKVVNKQQCPLFQNSKQLQFLGFGIPLYFIFVKYCIVLLFILIASYNGLALYWAISDNQQFCSHRRLSSGLQASCSSFQVLFARIQHQVSGSQLALRIASFILHLFALVYIRDKIRKTLQYYDQRTTSLSHYSLLIKHLPHKAGIQKCITNFIHKHFNQQWQQLKSKYKNQEFHRQTKVMKIILLPNLDGFYQLQDEKNKLIEDKKKQIRKQVVDKKEVNRLQALVELQQQRINEYCRLQSKLAETDSLQSQQAIVILNSQFFKQAITQYSSQNALDNQLVYQYFGQIQGQIQIEQAPQPRQIIWKNINYPVRKRAGRIVVGWLLTLLFLSIVTIVFYFLLRAKTDNLIDALQRQVHQPQSVLAKEHKRNAVALVYIIIVLIILFNKLLMGWVLHYFAHIEKHFSTSDQQFSFAFKYTLGLFFTTALMTLAVEAVSFHNFYSHPYGVIQQEGIMFFMNALFIQFIWLVNPWQIYVLIKRKIKEGKKDLTQRQANQLMEDNEYTVGKRYAEVIQTMWFTFLYATLIPFGACLTIIGVSLYYWIDKYNLLRRSSLKYNLSGQMTLFSLKLLDVTLFLRVVGQMIFDYQVRDGVNTQSIVFSVIALIYLIIPIDSILDYFHEQKFRLQQKSYQQVQYNFIQTYSTLHLIMNRDSKRTLRRIQRISSKILTLANQGFSTVKNQKNQKQQNLIAQRSQNKIKSSVQVSSSTNIKLKPTFQIGIVQN